MQTGTNPGSSLGWWSAYRGLAGQAFFNIPNQPQDWENRRAVLPGIDATTERIKQSSTAFGSVLGGEITALWRRVIGILADGTQTRPRRTKSRRLY